MRNKFKKIIAASLSCIGLTAMSFGVAGCVPKSTAVVEPDNIEIYKVAPPEDGSLPTAHSCAENLAYINYVFDHQPVYHSYSYGVTSASIATQTTRTFRDFKDGILMTTDLTYSSMVKNGTQALTVFNEEGEGEVYMRASEPPQADTVPTTAVWSEEAPTHYTKRAYNYTYGLLPNELFNYIVNEQNIVSAEEIKVNPDGTYTQNFALDPVASTYFYQFGMKTRGGLSAYPEFISINFSVTFDESWQILNSSMHEVSKVNKGVIVESVSDFTCEYYYGGENFDNGHYDYYNDYFKQYLGDETLNEGGNKGDEKPVIDVTNVLSNGFSQIMNGGEQFEIKANIGENDYSGLVFVSLDLADPLGTIALKAGLGKDLKNQNLYVEYAGGELAAYYGNDFAIGANLAETKLAIGQLGEVLDKISAAIQNAKGNPQADDQAGQPADQPADATVDKTEEQEEGQDPLAALMDQMVLVAGEKQAVLSLNTDDLLGLGIGIDVQLVFGIDGNAITFRGGTVSDLSFGGESLPIGLTIRTTTAPMITHDKVNAGANLADYVADVYNLLNSDLIEVNLNLNGDGEGVNIAALKGVNANVKAFADLSGITVGAEANVSYQYEESTISAKAQIWYLYGSEYGDYGTAVLSLKELNGVSYNANLQCDIKELADGISNMLTYAGARSGAATSGLADILTGALSADFSKLLTDLYADGSKIKLGVSVDEILNMLNVNTGIKFGSCALEYAKGEGENGGKLCASLPALGFTLTVSGKDGALEVPDYSGYFDLNALINLVHGVWGQIDGIIENKAVAFDIENDSTYLLLDGIKVDVWGNGEVSWANGGEYVVLDLAMSITEHGSDATDVKLIYDKNAVETPLVQLAINSVGLEIYKDDIDGAVNGFNDIYNKVTALTGGNAVGGGNSGDKKDDGANGTLDLSGLTSNDKLMSLLFGILSDDSWVNVLNDFTLTVNDKSLALAYLADSAANIVIGADDNITLNYDARLDERFSLGGAIVAHSNVGSLRANVEDKLKENCNMSSTKTEGSAGFIRLAYDFLFESLSNISVENILGSDTYAVTFKLDGNNCGAKELQDVYVDAEIYITGASGTQNKLAEGNLNLNVAGVAVELNVITERINNNTHFYINLNRVADIILPDLRVLATQESLYETFEVLIKAINNTDVLDKIGGLLGQNKGNSGETQNNNTTDDCVITDDKIDKIASLIEKILNLDLEKPVSAAEVNGVLTAEIDLDNILKQLGVNVGSLGSVKAVINHNDHSMTTYGKAYVNDADGVPKLKTWISLSSAKTERRSYDGVEREKYISIEFLPDLINDLVNTVTDKTPDDSDRKLYDSFTFSGKVSANVVSLLNINLDISTLTVDIGSADGLNVSLIAHLSGGGVSDDVIGLTYQNGYLTLGRKLATKNPEFRIMTFEYFLDNMFASSDNSSLNYLLGVNSLLWNMLKGKIGELANIDSGLTTPENIYLYKHVEDKKAQEISVYDYIRALGVKINGKESAKIGDITPVEDEFGITDNYYGFALDGEKVTGGVITKLYAAITRADDGIRDILASGAIQSYVTFNAKLSYVRGLTAENNYVFGTELNSGVSAPSLYNKAVQLADAAKVNIEFDHKVNYPGQYDEIFGCFDTASMKNSYSHMLYSHTVTVVKLDNTEQKRTVRHGSTIHLYDNASPVYTDDDKQYRLLYSPVGADGELFGKQITVNGDITIYEVRRGAVTIEYHNGDEVILGYSFVGDTIPLTANGMASVSAVRYGSPDGELLEEGTVIEKAGTIHLYGDFVQQVIYVNDVEYTFDASTMSYVVSGKGERFNSRFCDGNETLVLESKINGRDVTAIKELAFANTENKALKNVVVPATITTVGQKAFLDNVGLQSVVFLAPEVIFEGKFAEGEDGNTTPFYGCSTDPDGNSTNLKIYYNIAKYEGSSTNLLWTKFRRSGSGAIYKRYYIGCDPRDGVIDYDKNGGGQLYSAGAWSYVEYAVNVDLNGATDGELSQESASKLLSEYFPYVTAGRYEGSAYETTVKNAFEAGLDKMRFTKNGISYICDYTVTSAEENGKTILTYNVTYKKAASVYIESSVAFEMLGKQIAANTRTLIDVPVDGDTINLPTPVLRTHDFNGWTLQSQTADGNNCYTANWTEKPKYQITLNIKKGTTDNNNIYLNGEMVGKNKNPTITVYKGKVSVEKVEGENKIRIFDGVNTYTVWVMELKLDWFTYVESGNLRNISTIYGDKDVSGNTEIVIKY